VGIVDYIQDVTNSRQKGVGTNDREQTGHKSNTIKELSYGLRVPFVMCAQVSGEKTAQPQDDLRPKMFSAQHSSTLHQDADTVLALYRADYYVAQFGPQWKDNGETPESETLEVIVRKNRNGGLTTVKMDTDFSTGWLGRPMSLHR
jgi:replicative DNA helicase